MADQMRDTEKANPGSMGLDTRDSLEIARMMHAEDRAAVGAVEGALPAIAAVIDDAVSALLSGGRTVYAGAGTSGRLGMLDAAEVGPTFGSDRFLAVMAGGPSAMLKAAEGAEDDEHAGAAEAARTLTAKDIAIGITASGRTPFVLAFLREAKSIGARTALIACCETPEHSFIDHMVIMPTGAELIAGSTRLKAGTVTKLALNMISTATMVRLGGTFDGLMVDVVPGNAKLIARAEGIIMRIAGCPQETASAALKTSGMRPKTAALMAARNIGRDDAERLLNASGGSLRKALSAHSIKP